MFAKIRHLLISSERVQLQMRHRHAYRSELGARIALTSASLAVPRTFVLLRIRRDTSVHRLRCFAHRPVAISQGRGGGIVADLFYRLEVSNHIYCSKKKKSFRKRFWVWLEKQRNNRSERFIVGSNGPILSIVAGRSLR